MSERYTHKDAEKAVQRLAEAMSLPYGHYTTVDDEPESFEGEQPEGRYKTDGGGYWVTTQPGALELDYAPIYGGCIIQQMADDGGTWISEPFSRERKGPREFVGYVNALITGMELAS